MVTIGRKIAVQIFTADFISYFPTKKYNRILTVDGYQNKIRDFYLILINFLSLINNFYLYILINMGC